MNAKEGISNSVSMYLVTVLRIAVIPVVRHYYRRMLCRGDFVKCSCRRSRREYINRSWLVWRKSCGLCLNMSQHYAYSGEEYYSYHTVRHECESPALCLLGLGVRRLGCCARVCSECRALAASIASVVGSRSRIGNRAASVMVYNMSVMNSWD